MQYKLHMSMTAAKSGWEWIQRAEGWRYLCDEDKSFNQAVNAHTRTRALLAFDVNTKNSMHLSPAAEPLR